MKILLIFLMIVVGCAVIGGLLAGFVYGIVRRGRQLDKANETLRSINEAANLWDDLESPLASSIKQKLNTHYNGKR